MFTNLLYNFCYGATVDAQHIRKRRLAATAARNELSAILHEFAAIEEPSDSIADCAVRLGIYKEDSGVLLPLADFEQALELEEMLEDLLLELTIADRIRQTSGKTYSIEEVARDLGLAEELGLE